MPAASVVIPAGALRFARAPRPGLLPATTQKAQISAGLSFCLDEKRGSRQNARRPQARRGHKLCLDRRTVAYADILRCFPKSAFAELRESLSPFQLFRWFCAAGRRAGVVV